MAFTVAARHSANNGAVGSQTITTNSVTPTANSLLLAFYGTENNGHATYADLPAPTGGGLSFTLQERIGHQAPAIPWTTSTDYRLAFACYSAPVGGSPAAHTLAVDPYTGTQTAIIAVAAVDITGHNATTPVVQKKVVGVSVNPASDTAAGTLTLTTAPTAGNLLVVGIYSGADTGGTISSPTVGAGKTMTQHLNPGGSGWSIIGVWSRVCDGTESATITTADLGQQVGAYSIVALEIAPASGGGTTPVSTSRSTTWATRAATSRTTATTWAARATQATTRTSTWATRSKASTSRQTAWDVAGALASVATSRATSWTIRASAAASAGTVWATRSAASVARAVSWDVRESVAATRASSWRTLVAITSARTTAWVTSRDAGTTRATSWASLAPTTATRSTSWVTRAAVEASRGSSWAVQAIGSVVTTRVASWVVWATAAASRETSWETRTPAITARPTTWVTSRPLSALRATAWAVLQSVVTQRATSWAVQRITGNRDITVLELHEVPRPFTVAEATRPFTVTEVAQSSAVEVLRPFTITGGTMNLNRRAREFYTLAIDTEPAVAGWELSIDSGSTWTAGEAVGGTWRWLMAGPSAPDDSTAAIAVTETVRPLLRAVDNPEVLVRNAPKILLR